VVSPEELSRLWNLHAGRLLLIARVVGEPAEDAVQEAFVRLAQQPGLPRDPLAWLVQVARNQLLQWHRTGKRRQRRDEDAGFARGWFTIENNDSSLDQIEMLTALQKLADPQRQIVVMRIWGEMSFAQIGEAMSMSSATAYRRYAEAIEVLRDSFDCSYKRS
jgi:RNA polymerase sigma-70 factor (ECF subfamily)